MVDWISEIELINSPFLDLAKYTSDCENFRQTLRHLYVNIPEVG